jgi:hypothetical protein
MRKIFFIALSAVCFVAAAQAQKVVSISKADNHAIEYTVTELRHSELKELISTLPATVTITDEESDIITIAAPTSVFPYLKFDFRDDTLAIASDNDAPKKVMATLNQKCHIEVTIPSQSLRSITNTSDMQLYFESGKCADKLLITNTLTMGIISTDITAESNIEICNTGTMTMKVDNINTEQLFTLNTGYLYMRGATTANSILQNSAGIENSLLNVNCQKLEILSTGEGIIEYHGIADDVTVANMGKAKIKTSKLNNFAK